MSHTLRLRILLLICIAAAPLLAARLVQIGNEHKAQLDASVRESSVVAALAAEQHADLTEKVRTLLEVLVHVPAVVEGAAGACHAMLQDVAMRALWQGSIWVVDDRGRGLCGSRNPNFNIDISDRTYFQEVLATRAFVHSDYLVTKTRSERALVLAMPALREDGSVRSVVLATLDLDYLSRWDTKGQASLLLDADGRVLSWSPDGTPQQRSSTAIGALLADRDLAHALMVEGAVVADGRGPDGLERVWGVATLEATKARVAVGQARAAIESRYSNEVRMSVLVALAVTTAATILAWIGAEILIIRNVRTILTAAGRIGAGDLTARAEVGIGAGELKLVAEALNATARAVADREAALRESQGLLETETRLLETTLNTMDEGLLMVDADGIIQVYNDRVLELLDLPREMMEARPSLDELRAFQIARNEFMLQDDGFRKLLTGAAEDAPAFYERERPNGVVLEVRTVPLPGGGIVRTFTDVTSRRAAERKIAHLAQHDALTNLPNRALLRNRLDAAIARNQRSAEAFAVLCIDLDEFKAVNDSMGHPVGDDLLDQVAKRLLANVRAEDTVARLGGDEFVVIQTGLEQPIGATALAERLVASLSRPFSIAGAQICIGASVGISTAPVDGLEAELLLRNADLALYRAKADGGRTFRLFEPAMDDAVKAQRALVADLREAVPNGELNLNFQPIVDVVTREVVAFEALVRWQSPKRGVVPPDVFIPAAENTGLIVPIGEWVLRHACQEAASWPASVRVAVNVSAAQLKGPAFVQTVVSALGASGLEASRLELEITESVIMQESDVSVKILHQLRNLGVRISMDDFGTGYSSLSYLRSFPFDKIKIDRSFIRELVGNADCAAIVKAIVGLGRHMEIRTTAEGVETVEQLAALQALGCSEAQGYFISAPKPAREALNILPAARRAARG